MATTNNKTLSIPVIFYDGETQINIGNTQITPTITTFKLLQSTLSTTIGISPNQITIYFQTNYDHTQLNCYNNSVSQRRRRPVTSKFDFGVPELSGGFFWVVLKRGRRHRRHRNGARSNDVDWEYLEYVERLRMVSLIEAQKQRFIMDFNNNYYNYNVNCDYEDISSCSSSERLYCDVCWDYEAAGDDDVPFHWCKNDVVTIGFRSGVSPIAPPSKNRR